MITIKNKVINIAQICHFLQTLVKFKKIKTIIQITKCITIKSSKDQLITIPCLKVI
jgi:hypothetical protein